MKYDDMMQLGGGNDYASRLYNERNIVTADLTATPYGEPIILLNMVNGSTVTVSPSANGDKVFTDLKVKYFRKS